MMKTVELKSEFESMSSHEQLSALHDGHLSAEMAAALVRQSLRDESIMQQWRSMSAIGNVLREQQTGLVAQNIVTHNHVAIQSAVVDRQEAANDGVFRWKMVAGLAVFAAVGSLAWGLLGNSGAGVGDQMAASRQLQNAPATANGTSAQSLITVGGQIAGQEVMMIRDPRLDELLAAHKQFGGSSALHQAAGSLRSVSIGSVRP